MILNNWVDRFATNLGEKTVKEPMNSKKILIKNNEANKKL